jgi:hypothetical protein
MFTVKISSRNNHFETEQQLIVYISKFEENKFRKFGFYMIDSYYLQRNSSLTLEVLMKIGRN